MGIQGLLPLLKEISVHGNIKDFVGKRLAVDAYVWLHKGAFGCAEDLVKGTRTTKFVDYAMYRVRLLKHHGITPFIVFDGGPLPAKKGTEVSRAKSRAENLARATSLESQGRQKEARDYYTKCVDITPEMAYQLIKALRAENVEYVVAPYEADAQLYYLEREGYVDGIITEDSDLLVFGCKQVIFKLDGDGNCVHIHRDKLATISQFPMDGWTNTQFRRMAMLSGCDYLPSIPGIGLKKAHGALRRYKTVEKVLMQLRLEGSHKVPDNYIQAFNQAELAFMHQRVYCPREKRLRPINDFPEAGLGEEDERWIGLDVDVEIAQGMASGDIHPETRIAIVDEWPDFQPGSRSVAAVQEVKKGGVLVESTKVNIGVKTGPMDAFISRKKVILPRPVGTNSSGPTRLSDLTPRSMAGEATLTGPKRSKFFGGSAPARNATAGPSRQRGMMRWPSGEGAPAEEEKLVWEKSDEAGPEVDIESPARPALPPADTGAQSSPIRSPSPTVSSLHVQSSPARRGNRFEHSPDGPNLSSPPNIQESPVKLGRMLSSPPDIKPTGGRREEDPFSPSPARVIPMAKDGYVLYESRGSTPRVSSAPASQTPTRKGKVAAESGPAGGGRGVTMIQKDRLRVAKRELGIGSSDSIEDEVVTPSYDAAWGVKREMGREEDDDDVVMTDEDDEEVLRKVEEERRVEKAKTVAMGWRSKFALNAGGVSGSKSSPRAVEPAMKRRKTDPTPSGPATPSFSFPTPRSQPSVLNSQRDPKPIATGLNTPTVTNPTSRPNIQVSKQSRTGMASMPLSAFAPRILSVKSLNAAVKLPSSPEEVRRERAGRAAGTSASRAGPDENAMRGGTRVVLEKVEREVVESMEPAKSQGGSGGGGGLARFMFSGEVVRTREVL